MNKQDKEHTQDEASRGQSPERTTDAGKDDKKQQADTGRIDQQEGDMDNGELGGNMGRKLDEK